MAGSPLRILSSAGGNVVAMSVGQREGVFAPHQETVHAEHVLSYVVRGHLRVEAGAIMDAKEGSLGLIPAGVPHRSLGGTGKMWSVAFCTTCLRLDDAEPVMRPFRAVRAGAIPLFTAPSARRTRVQRWFRELQEELTRDSLESAELARSLLVLLLGEVCRATPWLSPVAGRGLVVDALSFVQTHALSPISLRDVAKAVARTPSYVAGEVKAATGHSVGDWIRAARVAEASARLVHTSESLEEIAHRVGWSDKTHFIRQFKLVHGQTPAAWRQAHRRGPRLVKGVEPSSGSVRGGGAARTACLHRVASHVNDSM